MQITWQTKDVNKTSRIGTGIEDAANRHNENDALDPPTPRNEAKAPHGKRYPTL